MKYVRNHDGWRERLGDYPRIAGRVIWIHAASVGEVNATSSLIERFRNETPEYTLIVSAFTRTGKLRARQLYGSNVYYAPLDFPFFTSRALSRTEPEALILVETELWPNLITQARKRGCRVYLVNGRITQKSMKRYRMFSGMMRTILSSFSHFMMQSAEHAARLKELGADNDRIRVIGNLKSDAGEGSPSREAMRAELGLQLSDEVVVAGSTREGEEEMVLQAMKSLRKRITLVVAPRHPNRVPKLQQMIEAYGFRHWRRTEGNTDRGEILLVDTIGELASIYGAADIAFIGGSFFPYGGHNPLEAAAHGIPVLFGPYMENDGGTRLKESGGGIEVKDAQELQTAIVRLLENPEERLRIGARAKNVLQEVRGASQRAFSLIRNELNAHRPVSEGSE